MPIKETRARRYTCQCCGTIAIAGTNDGGPPPLTEGWLRIRDKCWCPECRDARVLDDVAIYAEEMKAKHLAPWPWSDGSTEWPTTEPMPINVRCPYCQEGELKELAFVLCGDGPYYRGIVCGGCGRTGHIDISMGSGTGEFIVDKVGD